MPDRIKRLIKYIALGLIVGILIAKFAWPSPDGPTNLVEPESGLLSSQTSDSNPSVALEPNPNPTSNEQTNVNQQLPMWLLFRSQTCAPCREMQKTFDLLKPDFASKVQFVTVDVNDPNNEKLLTDYKIRYIPTIYLFDKHKQLFYQQIGVVSVEEMRAKLNALVEVP